MGAEPDGTSSYPQCPAADYYLTAIDGYQADTPYVVYFVRPSTVLASSFLTTAVTSRTALS
jgi:hypothetical protein